MQAARRARVVVATSRELPTLHRAAEQLDVLVGSAEDAGERVDAIELDPAPRAVVTTSGGLGRRIRPGCPVPRRAAPRPGSRTRTAAATASPPA